MPVGRFVRLLGSKEGHPACCPCACGSLLQMDLLPYKHVALNCCFSMQRGLLITCVWTTLIMLLFSPLHHLSLPETLCSAPCSLPPVLTISSLPSEPLVTQLL